ncbi:hypothetical protein ACGFW5_07475 [Streptomyces sp. NPDC048416]|uniref:hypothetical protein n=1 Tax=Streptomyces sp. NPDC048416 TaxID=3365546 RepID=UPI00371F51BE
MPAVNGESWAAALRALYEDEYVFVAVGPRLGPSLGADVLAVMRREVPDPRGWGTQDWDRDHEERGHGAGAAFPFTSVDGDAITSRLAEVDIETAAQLLVAFRDDWCRLPRGRERDDRPGEPLSKAWALLSRFAPELRCYTNLTTAPSTTSLDLAAHAAGPGWLPFTGYTADYGLVVVSSTEVGVFWSFNPI